MATIQHDLQCRCECQLVRKYHLDQIKQTISENLTRGTKEIQPKERTHHCNYCYEKLFCILFAERNMMNRKGDDPRDVPRRTICNYALAYPLLTPEGSPFSMFAGRYTL